MHYAIVWSAADTRVSLCMTQMVQVPHQYSDVLDSPITAQILKYLQQIIPGPPPIFPDVPRTSQTKVSVLLLGRWGCSAFGRMFLQFYV